MKLYFYYLPDSDETPRHARGFESAWTEEYGEWIAEDAAEVEGENCPDWRPENWPMRFTILREDRSVLGTYLVHQDWSPVYSAESVVADLVASQRPLDSDVADVIAGGLKSGELYVDDAAGGEASS